MVKVKSWVKIFLLIAICLGLLEGVSRVFDPWLSKRYFFVRDEVLGWKINDSHQRSIINLDQVDKDRLMYALGDSFAYGMVPYEKNYLTLTDKEVSEIDIVNLGLFGYGLSQYFDILQRYFQDSPSKYVLLNFYVGNDFRPTQQYKKELFEFFLKNGVIESETKFSSILTKHVLSLYRFYASGIKYNTIEGYTGAMDEIYNYNLIYRMPFYLDPLSSELDPGIEENLKIFDDIINYAKDKNTKLLVAILPDELQISSRAQQFVWDNSDYDEDQFSPMMINKILTDFLEERNIAYIDLTPSFIQASSTVLYIEEDTHWNNAGNALAANILTDWLKIQIQD